RVSAVQLPCLATANLSLATHSPVRPKIPTYSSRNHLASVRETTSIPPNHLQSGCNVSRAGIVGKRLRVIPTVRHSLGLRYRVQLRSIQLPSKYTAPKTHRHLPALAPCPYAPPTLRK